MQPFSRVDTAFEVKSSTQDVKQCSTSPPKAFSESKVSLMADWRFGGTAYAHKLFYLALLHALLQGALLGLC